MIHPNDAADGWGRGVAFSRVNIFPTYTPEQPTEQLMPQAKKGHYSEMRSLLATISPTAPSKTSRHLVNAKHMPATPRNPSSRHHHHCKLNPGNLAKRQDGDGPCEEQDSLSSPLLVIEMTCRYSEDLTVARTNHIGRRSLPNRLARTRCSRAPRSTKSGLEPRFLDTHHDQR